MKKADYMIVGIALMLALVSFGVYRLYFASTGRAAIVEITVDGNVYKTLSLKEDATVVVPSDGGHKKARHKPCPFTYLLGNIFILYDIPFTVLYLYNISA
ncbi:putative uncharacterized protein [Clostridium sp. CAG:75]|nr:putative uncharacterized protein [Clostridium sp. CAG:75]